MGVRLSCARAVAALSTWGLKHVFHRPAANFPGKIALYVDPNLIGHLADRCRKGSVAVVGTNGKTTVTNLLADTLQAAGESVICNRTGANLDSGVSTALLHAQPSDWGVFESDELWLAKIAPQLKPRYVVLLNLFRDQLDRVGEIDRIQDSIVGALASTPQTTLVFNADDPLCAAIAARVDNPAIAFGVEGDMGLEQNTVADAQMCQRCSTMMEYAYRQYGQLGEYRCPSCGFARPARDWRADDVELGVEDLSFAVSPAVGEGFRVHASLSGAYLVYNLLAVAVAARLCGASPEAIQRAIDAFDPQNGRLQRFTVQGRDVLLNLAKNPTGFNQNVRIILKDTRPKTVAFFINDKEADGRDVSWLWDIDFEELADQDGIHAFAGGIRANDMQVRLKYAGISAQTVADAADVLARTVGAADGAGERVYLIANYTALPAIHAELTRMAQAEGEAAGEAAAAGEAEAEPAAEPAAVEAADAAEEPESAAAAEAEPESAPAAAAEPAPAAASEPASAVPAAGVSCQPTAPASDEKPLVIAHLFPDLLNLYGDGGNVTVLARRARERGIPVEVFRVKHGQQVDLSQVDLVFLGGGPDREQRLASEALLAMRDDLKAFVESDGALLAICGGYQILGSEWLLGDDSVEGLGIVDMVTKRAEGGSGNRLIDNIVLKSPIAQRPVVGYENHAGRTHLGEGVQPFGSVISSTGHGNNDADKADGVLYRSVLGTYLHGPLLPKNPEVADWLLARALEHRAARTGVPAVELAPLDDAPETEANEALCRRFNIKQ